MKKVRNMNLGLWKLVHKMEYMDIRSDTIGEFRVLCDENYVSYLKISISILKLGVSQHLVYYQYCLLLPE